MKQNLAKGQTAVPFGDKKKGAMMITEQWLTGRKVGGRVEPWAIYVLEGGEGVEGWHNFETYAETVTYCERLMKADIDFILNPEW